MSSAFGLRKCFVFLCVVTVSAQAGIPREAPRWMLGSYLDLSVRQPAQLLTLAEQLFDEGRIRQGTLDPALAFEWQKRLAMASALSNLFDPSFRRPAALATSHRKEAKQYLQKALLSDPSLLVRDGAVESIRRILRMQPVLKKEWQAPLERAFFDAKNQVEGEGLFIRETILTTLREASLTPSRRLRSAATEDKNSQVRDLLKKWKTTAFDELH